MDDYVLMKIWHGGKLIPKPKLHYVGGESNMFKIDVDKMSYFELMDYVIDCGSYKSKNFDMYYLVPGKKFDEGLVHMKDDKDVSEMMVTLGDPKHMLHLYVQDQSSTLESHPVAHVNQNKAQHCNVEAHPVPQINPNQAQPSNETGFTKNTTRKLPITPTKETVSPGL